MHGNEEKNVTESSTKKVCSCVHISVFLGEGGFKWTKMKTKVSEKVALILLMMVRQSAVLTRMGSGTWCVFRVNCFCQGQAKLQQQWFNSVARVTLSAEVPLCKVLGTCQHCWILFTRSTKDILASNLLLLPQRKRQGSKARQFKAKLMHHIP